MKNSTRLLAVILLIASFTACKKSLDNSLPPGDPAANGGNDSSRAIIVKDSITGMLSFPSQPATRCPGAPDYGDSIIFQQPVSGSDYIVSPLNHPDTGTYYAWPQGMVIDKNTGAINVSKSETGMRYSIAYIKKGTTDTCLQNMVLGGISYEDSLYVLSSDERYAKPYYNADPSLPPVCTSSNAPGNGCLFDTKDQAASQHVIIDKNTGIIDLKNTANKAFGLIPLNGTTVKTTFTYRLKDKSNRSYQQITLNLVYYNRKSDVPADLLAVVQDKLNKILGQVLLINLFNSTSQSRYSNPRPPIIIVTRFAL